MKLMIGIAVALALALLFRHAGGQSYTPGRAGGQSYTRNATPTPLPLNRPETRVIDGDTLVLNGVHVRLYGIDAAELGQKCSDGWPAGEKARGFLRVLVEGQSVSCDNRGLDKYGRTLAVCRVGATDLNQALVRTGNAWAYSRYSRAYVLDEITARQARAGVWAHNCTPAWEWRHKK